MCVIIASNELGAVMNQMIRDWMKTYLKMKGMKDELLEHPAFDLFDCVDFDTNNYDNYKLEAYCNHHIKVEEQSVIFQIEDKNEYCVLLQTIHYRIASNRSLSKTKRIIHADFLSLEQDELFEEEYGVKECFGIDYTKEHSIYDSFGMEWTRRIRKYHQTVPRRSDVEKMLLIQDPDLFHLIFSEEIFVKRMITLDSVRIQIRIPALHNNPYCCQCALKIEKGIDLLHFSFHNPNLLQQLVHQVKVQKIEKDKIQESSVEDVYSLIAQIEDTQIREYLFTYLKKEPCYDSKKPLELTMVNYL